MLPALQRGGRRAREQADAVPLGAQRPRAARVEPPLARRSAPRQAAGGRRARLDRRSGRQAAPGPRAPSGAPDVRQPGHDGARVRAAVRGARRGERGTARADQRGAGRDLRPRCRRHRPQLEQGCGGHVRLVGGGDDRQPEPDRPRSGVEPSSRGDRPRHGRCAAPRGAGPVDQGRTRRLRRALRRSGARRARRGARSRRGRRRHDGAEARRGGAPPEPGALPQGARQLHRRDLPARSRGSRSLQHTRGREGARPDARGDRR